MAEIVRRRSWGGVLPLGRHVSISGSRSIHAPSVSIAPSSFQEEQNARHHKQFKLEQALAQSSCRMSGGLIGGRPGEKLFLKIKDGWGFLAGEIFYPALAARWPTAFQRVGAEPWVIHGPGPLRPGPQRTGTKSASWKAEGAAVFSRSARAKKGQIEEQNRTAVARSSPPRWPTARAAQAGRSFCSLSEPAACTGSNGGQPTTMPACAPPSARVWPKLPSRGVTFTPSERNRLMGCPGPLLPGCGGGRSGLR